MSGGIVRLGLACVAALATAWPASASPVFNGNVCALLTAKQVTAIAGVTSSCKNQAPLKGVAGANQYVGNWAGQTRRSPSLQVTIAVYPNAKSQWLQLADHNLMQGLSGPPKKVTGIGDAAYEAKGDFAVDIHVAVGTYIAYITLSQIGKDPSSPALIEPIAKDVAAKL